MAIKFDTFKVGSGGAGTDNLDDVTSRGSITTNSITVGGVTVGTEYSLPSVDGLANQVISTNGSGTLTFTTLDFTGGLEYKGAFNATAGTPSLLNAEKGDFYIIDTAGTIYGKDWQVGDHLLINEDMGGTITNSKIDKIDNSEAYTTLASLTDTNISSPVNGQVLKHNGTNWVNVQLAYSELSGTPTNVSTFTNDANYVASGDNVSVLTNDANYVASGDNVSTLTNDAGYLTDITSESLGDLSDVTVTTPTSGQVLSYNGANWVNSAASSGSLAGLSDTTITSPANGEVLKYNGSSWVDAQLAYSELSGTPTNVSTFTNDANYVASGDNVSTLTNDANYVASGDNVSTLTNDANYVASGDNVSVLTNDAGYLTDITGENLGDLSDVTVTTPTSGQVLSYNGASWVNSAASSGSLAGLSDVTITAAANGDYLRYNGSAWVDATLAIIDDTTPSLGGDLDVNGNSITSSANGDVTINPDGTGSIAIGADVIPDADVTHTLGSEDFRYITTYSDLNGAVRFKAKNDEGSAITAGQVLYIKGLAGDGETPTVGLADADDASKMPAFGLAYAGANDQAEVQVVSFGNLYNVNTSSFSVGDTLYVSTTAGALTNTKPTGETSQLQNIGRVVRSDASAGVITVGGAGRSAATPNLNDGYFFLGNASNQSVSTQLSSINVSTFVNDANYVASGDNVSVLTNDAGYLANINSESLGDLSDVTVTTPSSGQVLSYNGTNWVNAAASGGSVPAVTSATPSSDYTISTTSGIEEIYLLNPSVSINVNLPSAVTAGSGYKYTIKNLSGAYSLTVDPNSTETIDGSGTYQLNVHYQSLTIVSDGTNWHII